jgi:hypothetical protein
VDVMQQHRTVGLILLSGSLLSLVINFYMCAGSRISSTQAARRGSTFDSAQSICFYAFGFGSISLLLLKRHAKWARLLKRLLLNGYDEIIINARGGPFCAVGGSFYAFTVLTHEQK